MPFRDLDSLPWEERLLRFHELSEAAFRRAESASNPGRDEYLALGSAWYTLAVETEKLMREKRATR